MPEMLAFRFFDQYEGKPGKDYSAEALLSELDGRLSLVIGPKKVTMTLIPWDRDSFTVHWPVFGFDQEFGFANFEVDPQGRVKGLILDRLNQEDDLGVFKRVETVKEDSTKY